jgi:proteasome accessory factor C
MHAVAVVDEPRDHDDLRPRDLSEGLFEAGPDDIEAVIRLERWARWVADYYPVVATEELPGQRLQVTLRVGDPRWLVRLALRVAPALTIVSPAELQQQVLDTAASTLRLYDGVAGGGVA